MTTSQDSVPSKEVEAPVPSALPTVRQAECLFWVQEGKSSPDIGRILGISSRTVDSYVAKACHKFGVRTRLQAVIRARTLGLLRQNEP